jgi:hypothetical protein
MSHINPNLREIYMIGPWQTSRFAVIATQLFRNDLFHTPLEAISLYFQYAICHNTDNSMVRHPQFIRGEKSSAGRETALTRHKSG